MQQDGERQISKSKNDLHYLEKKLDDLIAGHSKTLEERSSQVKDLKQKFVREMEMARSKVDAILEKKQQMVEEASVRLLELNKEVTRVQKELDDARKKKLLHMSS